MAGLRNLPPGGAGNRRHGPDPGLYNRGMPAARATVSVSSPRRRRLPFAALLPPAVFFLAACGRAAPPAAANPLEATGIVRTTDAAATATELPPEPAGTVTPTAPDEPAPPGPNAADACENDLTFLSDLTFPDKTFVLPGQALEKSWKVRNSGTCDWGPGFRLRWQDGAQLAALKEIALYPAVAGSEAVIQVPLTVPLPIGEYVSNWRAVSPAGAAFGDVLYVDILVMK
jgi:hypothetical protein